MRKAREPLRVRSSRPSRRRCRRWPSVSIVSRPRIRNSRPRTTELKAVVERRDAETEYLKAQTKDLREEAAVATNEISKVKGTDWAKNVKLKGDLRYRHETDRPG